MVRNLASSWNPASSDFIFLDMNSSKFQSTENLTSVFKPDQCVFMFVVQMMSVSLWAEGGFVDCVIFLRSNLLCGFQCAWGIIVLWVLLKTALSTKQRAVLFRSILLFLYFSTYARKKYSLIFKNYSFPDIISQRSTSLPSSHTTVKLQYVSSSDFWRTTYRVKKKKSYFSIFKKAPYIEKT